MTGIWEFPDLEELEDFIFSGIERAKEDLIARFREEGNEERADAVERLDLERVVIVDEWGEGTAAIGEDILDAFLFFDMENEPEPHLASNFDPAARSITQRFVDLINEGEVQPPPDAMEWFAGFDPQPVAISRYEDQVGLSLGRREGNTVFDLTVGQAIVFREPEEPERPGLPTKPVSVENLPRLTVEQLRERVREPEPEPEVEEEIIEEEPEPEVLTAEQRVERSLQEFEVDDILDIPAGKPTRRVESRELYDFELFMGLPTMVLTELGFDPVDQITNAIGESIELGRFGNADPPATFPRTSTYVKHRLLNIGPAYVLELYRDLIVYSGFISSFHDGRFIPGRYSSFREYMYRLLEIGRRGGPTLVRKLSQQQAARRGLEVIPNHPTIPGAKAPWLQNRQYYEIIEENQDHIAWQDPVGFLQEELPEEEPEQ